MTIRYILIALSFILAGAAFAIAKQPEKQYITEYQGLQSTMIVEFPFPDTMPKSADGKENNFVVFMVNKQRSAECFIGYAPSLEEAKTVALTRLCENKSISLNNK